MPRFPHAGLRRGDRPRYTCAGAQPGGTGAAGGAAEFAIDSVAAYAYYIRAGA